MTIGLKTNVKNIITPGIAISNAIAKNSNWALVFDGVTLTTIYPGLRQDTWHMQLYKICIYVAKHDDYPESRNFQLYAYLVILKSTASTY